MSSALESIRGLRLHGEAPCADAFGAAGAAFRNAAQVTELAAGDAAGDAISSRQADRLREIIEVP
jgi:hypothetical protein